MGMVTFDWSQISYIGSPLATPWWAEANIAVGFVFFFWILTPALYVRSLSVPFLSFPLVSVLPLYVQVYPPCVVCSSTEYRCTLHAGEHTATCLLLHQNQRALTSAAVHKHVVCQVHAYLVGWLVRQQGQVIQGCEYFDR
jgi:hypothetical protein